MMCECNYWALQVPSHAGNYYFQQPQPQIDLMSYPSCYYGNPVSSSRLQRNQAEKQRRDKLNQFINELANLVPMVSTSAKKLDKTSILRLSATFLRMHQVLNVGKKGEKKMMKDFSIPIEWYQQLLEGMEGMLLVLTSTGKIVFLSYNVENILGHHPNDLLGKNLHEYTHREDIPELNRNLTISDLGSPYRSGDSSGRTERRSFFLRLCQRAASRSDQPQYEWVHIEGHLRVPMHQHGQAKNKAESGIGANETVLVAFVKPYKGYERYVTDNSLLEATKEEWITRHLIDGTIIFSDHRISILSGYLSEEVTGNRAFNYMHKDDVRWVIIALRQMYSENSRYGWSCYRLQSKNGEYIYLKTHGFLETDDKGAVHSFICINTLVTNEEGEKYIAEMKKKFTPMIEPAPAVTTLSAVTENPGPSTSKGETEELTSMLLCDLPQQLTVKIEQAHPFSLKVNSFAKTLPSVEVQSKQVGAKITNMLGKYDRPSVITSVSATGDRLKRSPEIVEEAEVKRLRGNKSVIVSDQRSQFDSCGLDTNFFTDLLMDEAPSSSFSQFSDDEPLSIPVEGNGSLLWETPVPDLQEKVLRGHIHLENRIQSQEVQLQEIEEDLQTVPRTSSHIYQTHITHLKAEHRKQRELLKTLQQDHQRQQTKDQISLRGAEQNIGV